MPTLKTSDPKEHELAVEYRTSQWKAICKKQFELAYYANISSSATDEMVPYELDLFHQYLVEQKQDEAEVQAKRIQAMQQESSKKKGRR